MPDAMISLTVLFDLDAAMRPYVEAEERIDAQRAVLRWVERHGFLSPRPDAVQMGSQQIFLSSAVFPSPPGEDNPAGPQASSGKPDPKAAGDLNAVADRPELNEAKAPKGVEGVSPPDEAPATPVAGGVAPEPVQLPGLAKLWSYDEDEKAIAMKLAGHTAHEIAAALGRPEAGTTSRLSKTLKARIDAARQAVDHVSVKVHPDKEIALGPMVPGALPDEAQPGEGDPLHVVEGPTVAAAIQEQDPAATVIIPASAPAFDPSQPGWWRAANANLSALGYRRPFNAQADLQLVEDLLKGMKLDVMAADMLISAVDLKNRWRALLSAVGTPEGKLPNIEEQTHLLEILRARASEKSLKAAE